MKVLLLIAIGCLLYDLIIEIKRWSRNIKTIHYTVYSKPLSEDDYGEGMVCTVEMPELTKENLTRALEWIFKDDTMPDEIAVTKAGTVLVGEKVMVVLTLKQFELIKSE